MKRTITWRSVFLAVVLAVIVSNYVAQIPYYLHLYYFPRHIAPSPTGVALLGLTLAWFLLGYIGLARGWRAGYWLLLTYLAAVVAFYLGNMLNQVANGFGPFFHVQTRDPILFVVFGVGYLNLVGGITFLALMAVFRRALLSGAAMAPATPQPRGD